MRRWFVRAGFGAGFLAFLIAGFYLWRGEQIPLVLNGLVVAGIGLMLIAAGFYDIEHGSYNRGVVSASRRKHPRLFWVYVFLFDFTLGIVGIGLGAWLLVR